LNAEKICGWQNKTITYEAKILVCQFLRIIINVKRICDNGTS